MREDVQKMLSLRERLMQGGGEKRIAKQHEKGKLTARERLALLFDEGTFLEYNLYMKHRCTYFGMEKVEAPSEGIVTGGGLINGRKAFAFAHDFTVLGGATGEMQGEKLKRILDLALEARAPIIGLNDSGGGRIQEGPDVSIFGSIFSRNVMSSGVIPQISAIMGPCAGGASYSPALTDFVIMVDKTSQTFVTGPNVIKSVMGESIDAQQLGGAQTHSRISGVAHLVAADDYDCIAQIKKLLSYFPSHWEELPPIVPTQDAPFRRIEELNDFVPENRKKAYDMKPMIRMIADDGDFFEIQPFYAQNIIIGFIRLDGMPVGVVSSQPKYMAGCLDINASDKAARFIRVCDAFNIPLLSLADVPGYLPGTSQEYGGIIRHGAKMLYAWAEATVPKLVVAIGKVFGGANTAMCSRDMDPDYIVAWPTAQRAIMGAESAVAVLHRKAIKAAENPDEIRQQFVDEYNQEFLNPYKAAERGKLEDIIEPAETRAHLVRALHLYWGKKKSRLPRKHGNIPL